MAEGYQEIEHVETFPLTLVNNFTLYNWGFIQLCRCGKIVIITASGLYRSVDTTSDTKIADLPFSVRSVAGTGAATDDENAKSPIIIASGTTLQINNLAANHGVFFNIVTTII